MVFFLDTYALIEIVKGNPHYSNFINEDIIITRLNLMELFYGLLRIFDEKTANHYFDFFLPSIVPISNETIKDAMRFRLEQRKKKNLISYVDCIGYLVALKHNVRFVSGEKHFLGLKNVEYVK